MVKQHEQEKAVFCHPNPHDSRKNYGTASNVLFCPSIHTFIASQNDAIRTPECVGLLLHVIYSYFTSYEPSETFIDGYTV